MSSLFSCWVAASHCRVVKLEKSCLICCFDMQSENQHLFYCCDRTGRRDWFMCGFPLLQVPIMIGQPVMYMSRLQRTTDLVSNVKPLNLHQSQFK